MSNYKLHHKATALSNNSADNKTAKFIINCVVCNDFYTDFLYCSHKFVTLISENFIYFPFFFGVIFSLHANF